MRRFVAERHTVSKLTETMWKILKSIRYFFRARKWYVFLLVPGMTKFCGHDHVAMTNF
jgi:hypothetical protein